MKKLMTMMLVVAALAVMVAARPGRAQGPPQPTDRPGPAAMPPWVARGSDLPALDEARDPESLVLEDAPGPGWMPFDDVLGPDLLALDDALGLDPPALGDGMDLDLPAPGEAPKPPPDLAPGRGAGPRPGAGIGPPHGRGMGPRPGPMMREMRMEHRRLGEELGLSKAQRDRLADLRERQMREAIRARADLALARIDLGKAMRADPPDVRAINAQIDKMARMRAELQKARVAAMLEMRTLLTDEQRQKLHERRMQGPPMRMRIRERIRERDGDI